MKARKDKILKFMKDHKRGITTLQAIKIFGETRLSGRIYDLRKEGHIIDGDWIEVKNRDGVEVRVKQYHLIKEKE